MENQRAKSSRRGAVISNQANETLHYALDSDDEENESEKNKSFNSWRKDTAVHKFFQMVSESAAFNGIIMLTIVVNSVFMMFEVNDSYASLRPLYPLFDIVFLTIYTIEFVVKIYAEPIDYWKSWSNRFDFFVLAISYIQVFMDQMYPVGMSDDVSSSWTEALPVLRTLKATRAIRALRAVSFVRGLQVLLTALIDTMKKSFINVMLILIFLMFLFAIFGYYMFGYKGGDVANWGDLGSAFLTLFSFVTCKCREYGKPNVAKQFLDILYK